MRKQQKRYNKRNKEKDILMNINQDELNVTKLRKIVSRKAFLVRWGNITASLFHGLSFTVLSIILFVTMKEFKLPISTDFVDIKEVTVSPGKTKSFFFINIEKVNFYPIYVIWVVPLITCLFHFFIGVIIPWINDDYNKLRNDKNVILYLKRTYFENWGRYVSFFSMKKSHMTWFNYYTNTILLGINPIRWFEYSITSSLIIIVIAALSTVTNAFLLVSLVVLNVILMWVGGNYFEQLNKASLAALLDIKDLHPRKIEWNPYIIGCLIYGWQWFVIFFYFISASVQASSDVPIYAYIAVIGIFINFSAFAVNSFLHYIKAFKWISEASNYELVFLALSFISKFYIDWVLFLGVLLTTRDTTFE